MPILNSQPDIFPASLLAEGDEAADAAPFLSSDGVWWAVYTLSRHEKMLMRKLNAKGIPHYSPLVQRRFRSPNGRARSTFEPLFPNYVFMFADEAQRYAAMTTKCVSRLLKAPDADELVRDLRRIQQLIASGAALTPETRIEAGDRVRVKSGPLKGFEGVVLRRENEVRLMVAVQYLQRGASVVLSDNSFEAI
jgi:transcription antitermination factor NusG